MQSLHSTPSIGLTLFQVSPKENGKGTESTLWIYRWQTEYDCVKVAAKNKQEKDVILTRNIHQ